MSQVPDGLLDDCEKNHKDVLINSVRRVTNLYRRVSTISHRENDVCKRRKRDKQGNTCLVCTVTLVKSSKDPNRSGVKLRCPCNVRVCLTCFKNNPLWYTLEPHHSTCSTLTSFVCSVCAFFCGTSVKRCCAWMCTGCLENYANRCSVCSKYVDRGTRKEVRYLWVPSTTAVIAGDRGNDAERKVQDASESFKTKLRRRVVDKITNIRHISKEDAEFFFGDCFVRMPCP